MVDKKVLSSYSGSIKKMFSKSKGGKRNLKVIYHDFPGGAENFELITRFCHNNGNIDINPFNITDLKCSAYFMEMNKSVAGNKNLLEQTEKSLEGIKYWTWSELMAALKRCQDFFPVASSSGILEKCLDSLLGRVASSCETSPCPSVSSPDSSKFRASCDTRSSESLKSSFLRMMDGFVPMVSATFGNFGMSAGFGGVFSPIFNVQLHGFSNASGFGATSGYQFGNADSFHGTSSHVYRETGQAQQGNNEHTYSAPQKWMRGNGRITLQFGCCYNYAVDEKGIPPGILKNKMVDPLPHLFKVMIKRLIMWHVLPPSCVPDSCIVNIYEEGDCIPPHIDNHDFVRPFCTVSFLGKCDILFGSNLKIVGAGDFTGAFAISLPVGSVLVLNGNGADVAKHCVPAVPTRRISITFRKMDESKRPIGYVPESDLQGLQPLPYGADTSKNRNPSKQRHFSKNQAAGRERGEDRQRKVI